MTSPTKIPEGHRIAVLIDGDNAQSTLLDKMLAETSKYGTATIRRIYGDWTTSNMNSWKEMLHSYAVQPIQQFRYTIGKNATDSAMIIDAMDILYSNGVDGFCLISSDSDYTRLATRIREQGVFVMGIGKKNTPRAFVNACDVFVYAENLLPDREAPKSRSTRRKKTDTNNNETAAADTHSVEPPAPDPLPLLRNAFDLAVQEDGWAFLGTLGHHMRQLDPSFDPRTYGFKQLSQLIRSYSKQYEVKEERGDDGTLVIYVHQKDS